MRRLRLAPVDQQHLADGVGERGAEAGAQHVKHPPSADTTRHVGTGRLTRGASAANRGALAPFLEHVVASPHGVVTAHLIDAAGQPTIAARDVILSLFARRLGAGR